MVRRLVVTPVGVLVVEVGDQRVVPATRAQPGGAPTRDRLHAVHVHGLHRVDEGVDLGVGHAFPEPGEHDVADHGRPPWGTSTSMVNSAPLRLT